MVEHRIAQKVSWEIVALNDRGDGTPAQYTALEVVYGVALQIGDQPALTEAIMASIIGQISDRELQRQMRVYTARGLKQ